MKFKLLIFLILALALLLPGCVKQPVETTNEAEVFGTFTAEELTQDAEKLMNIMNAYSPMLYTVEDELQNEYNNALTQFEDGMTGLEFIRLMKPVIAALRCGHTHIYGPYDWGKIELLPMDIKIIDGRLHMIKSIADTKIPEGSEILSINGNLSGEILEKMLKGMSADGYNETGKINFINRMFPREYMHHVEYAFSFEIEYIDPDGKKGRDTVASMKSDKIRNKLWKSYKDLYESEFADNYAVLTVHTFNPNSKNSINDFNEFFDCFFLEVKEKGIGNVILDVRGNSGGDPMITSHLFSYLQKEPHPYFAPESPNYYRGLKEDIPAAENHFGGNLYILMDGGSFSSTGHLISLLKYQGVGTFIGEESGGHYVCTDSSRDRTLSNTNLNFHYSTEAWKVAVEGLEPGRGIMPDHGIVPGIEDYLSNRDPAMEYALSLIN
jgi:hypothetical protein